MVSTVRRKWVIVKSSKLETIEKAYHFAKFERSLKKIKQEYMDSTSNTYIEKLNKEILDVIHGILSLPFILSMLALLLPLVVFFAGVMIPIAIYAKSFKEAQIILSKKLL